MVFEDNLIELVKEHEFLYNTKSKGYKNVLKRASTWETIAKQLNRPVDECKTRWKSLRDRYVREKRKLELPSGSAALFDHEKWEFFDSLEFLIPALSTRRQTGNFGAEPDTGQNKIDDGNLEISESFDPGWESDAPPSASRKGAKRKSEEVLSEFLGGLKKTVTNHLQEQNRPPMDADDEFILNMAHKMSPLSEIVKISLHARIFQMVNEELINHYTS